MKKVLATLTDASHERLVQFQTANGFSNLDTALEALIMRAPVALRARKR